MNETIVRRHCIVMVSSSVSKVSAAVAIVGVKSVVSKQGHKDCRCEGCLAQMTETLVGDMRERGMIAKLKQLARADAVRFLKSKGINESEVDEDTLCFVQMEPPVQLPRYVNDEYLWKSFTIAEYEALDPAKVFVK